MDKSDEISWNYDMSSAPKTGWPIQHVTVLLASGVVVRDVHWASDRSGDCQPPFEGWFAPNGAGYYEITPIAWAPQTTDPNPSLKA